MFIVMVGNPADGFMPHGPFLDANYAGDWAEEEMRGKDWWTLALHMPDDERENWQRDDYQFPRLISEIMAQGMTESQWDGLLEAMDLESDDLSELFDRAQQAWERIKNVTT